MKTHPLYLTNDTFHRQSCARQHYILGHYLAVQAWIRGLDCIVLQRDDLEFFLGLQRFKSIRVGWLCQDLKPWFQHQEAFYHTGSPSSIHSLFLSRAPISEFLPLGSMTTDQRIARIAADAPKTATFFERRWVRERPSTADMISQLCLLSSGVARPASFQPKPRLRRRNPAPFVNPIEILMQVFPPKANEPTAPTPK